MNDSIVDQALASDVGTSLGELWMRRNLLALIAPADNPDAVTDALIAPDGGRPAAAAEFEHMLTESEQDAFVELAAKLLRVHIAGTVAKLARTARLLNVDVELEPRVVALAACGALPWPARPLDADPANGLP